MFTFWNSSLKFSSAAETWFAKRRSHLGEENRCAMMNEQRSKNFDGTTVGSWVDITTRVARCLCCRMTVRSESVKRAEEPD